MVVERAQNVKRTAYIKRGMRTLSLTSLWVETMAVL
jgi:hypothetical protein